MERIARLPADKSARIFYVSDFDPSGDAMPISVARQIEYYLNQYAHGRDVKLTPLVLSRDQVLEYDLPRKPIKPSDARRDDFQDRRGHGAVELDALEALHPGVLRRLVDQALDAYHDDGLEERLAVAKAEAADAVGEAWQEATTEAREEVERLAKQAKEITDNYRQKVDELNAQMQAELAPVREGLDSVWLATQGLADNLEVVLPERPEAEPDVPDEASWLFDSSRDYLAQVEAYQAWKGTVKTLEGAQSLRTCPVCSVEFQPKRNYQRFCGKRCSRKGSPAAPAEK